MSLFADEAKEFEMIDSHQELSQFLLIERFKRANDLAGHSHNRDPTCVPHQELC